MMKRLAAFLALPILISACWSDDSSTKQPSPAVPPAPAAAPPKALPAAPPQAAAPGLGIVWTWPSEYGEKRDLEADQKDCRAMASASDPALTQFKKVWDCMESRGWRRSSPTGQQLARQPAPSAPPDSPPLSELWIWAGDPATPHDVESDGDACKGAKNPAAVPLLQLKQFMDCMIAKGWQKNEATWKQFAPPQP